MAGAGRSEAEEAPVSAGHTFPGVSLPFVVPTPATPSRSERLAARPGTTPVARWAGLCIQLRSREIRYSERVYCADRLGWRDAGGLY